MNITGHFKTITRHRHLVMKNCFKAGIPVNGLLHDLSKYSPAEFIPGIMNYEEGKRSPNEHEREVKGYSRHGFITRAGTSTILNTGSTSTPRQSSTSR